MARVARVRWTPLALRDLNHAYHYIAQERPDAAKGVIVHIERALGALIQYPLMGREGRIPETRELYIVNTPFILAYRFRGSQLEIIALMHAARRWPEDL